MKQEPSKPMLWKRMRQKYDRATLRTCRMEIMGNRSVLLQGMYEILEYGHGQIHLGVEDAAVESIVITGRDLVCLSYHADGVLVEGTIDNILMLRHDGCEASINEHCPPNECGRE